MELTVNQDILRDILIRRQNSFSDFWNKRELLESPIEKMVFDHLFKFKNDDAELIPQKKINTISGNLGLI